MIKNFNGTHKGVRIIYRTNTENSNEFYYEIGDWTGWQRKEREPLIKDIIGLKFKDINEAMKTIEGALKIEQTKDSKFSMKDVK